MSRLKLYSKKADMFSLGVLLYEMITLKKPFDGGRDIDKLKNDILIGLTDEQIDENFDLYVGSEMKDIVRSLLSTDPKKRLDASEILAMPLFRYFTGRFLEIAKREVGNNERVMLNIFSSIRDRYMALKCPSFNSFKGNVLCYVDKGKTWKKCLLELRRDDFTSYELVFLNFEKIVNKIKFSDIVDVYRVDGKYIFNVFNSFAVMRTSGLKIFFSVDTPESRDAWVQAIQTTISAQLKRICPPPKEKLKSSGCCCFE